MSPTMKALTAIGLSLMFLVVSYWVSSLSDPAVVSWSNLVALSTYMLGTPFTALVVWWFMLTGRRGRLSSSQGPSLVAGLGFMLSAFWLHFALGVFCNHVEGDASFDATYEPVVALATGIDLLMLLVIVLCTWQVAFPRAYVHGRGRLREATWLLVGLLALYYTGYLLMLVPPFVMFVLSHGVSLETVTMFPILVDLAVIVAATGCWVILAICHRRRDSGGLNSQMEQALQP